jgi:site-specific recombinase XerD
MGCIFRYSKKGKQGPIWWLKYYRDGRAMYESSHSTERGEAVRILKTREGDIVKGLPVTPKIGRLKFDEAAADLLNDYKIKGLKSADEAERRIRLHLSPYFGGRRMSTITASGIRAFIAERMADTIVTHKARTRTTRKHGTVTTPEERRPVSHAEINRELTTLKRIFSLAVESEKLLHKPKIPMLREDNTRTGFFEHEQYTTVLRHLPEDLRPVVTAGYITGWRITSEVLPLQWPRVDFDAGEIRLDANTTKNDEPRIFPMTAELRRMLEEQKVEHDRLKKAGHIIPWVFWRMVAEHRGGPLKPKPIKSLGKAFTAACRAAGCPGRIPHDLRRTAVRNLVRAGVSETVAMKLTGHLTRSVFERYNITSARDLTDAARLLDAHTSQQRSKTAAG